MDHITGIHVCVYVCMTTLSKATRLVDVHVIAIAFLSLNCKCNKNFCDLQLTKGNTTKYHILFLRRTMPRELRN